MMNRRQLSTVERIGYGLGGALMSTGISVMGASELVDHEVNKISHPEKVVQEYQFSEDTNLRMGLIFGSLGIAATAAGAMAGQLKKEHTGNVRARTNNNSIFVQSAGNISITSDFRGTRVVVDGVDVTHQMAQGNGQPGVDEFQMPEVPTIPPIEFPKGFPFHDK